MSSSASPGAGPSAAAHSLDPVPPQARESTAGHQFWIWSGANIAPIKLTTASNDASS